MIYKISFLFKWTDNVVHFNQLICTFKKYDSRITVIRIHSFLPEFRYYLETLPVSLLIIISLVLSRSNFKPDFIDETDKTTTLVDILLRIRRYKLEWAYTESNNLHIKLSFVMLTFSTYNSVANQYQGGWCCLRLEIDKLYLKLN